MIVRTIVGQYLNIKINTAIYSSQRSCNLFQKSIPIFEPSKVKCWIKTFSIIYNNTNIAMEGNNTTLVIELPIVFFTYYALSNVTQ